MGAIRRDYSNFVEPLPHPGALLREDYLPQYGLTPGSLAKAMGLKDRTRIEHLVREKIGISADTAIRLAKVFGTSADLWADMQKSYELSKAAVDNRDDYVAIRQLDPLPEDQWPESQGRAAE